MTDKASDILDLLEGFLKKTEPPTNIATHQPQGEGDTAPTSESAKTTPTQTKQ